MNDLKIKPDPSLELPAVVITGATEGIGRAFAEEFARDRHTLVLVARDEARLAQVAAELARKYHVTVRVTAQDLASPEGCAGVEQALRRFGVYADILVNNAGIMSSGYFQDEDPARVERLIGLNVRAMADLTLRVLPGMMARRRGGVINVASLMGYMPVPYQAIYAASKAFVVSFTKALAYEAMWTGVRVSLVAPGVVATRLHTKAGSQNSRYLFWFPALTPEYVAGRAYRRFKRGWTVTMPGIVNKLGAFARRFTPDFMLIPLMGWLFRPRNEKGEVLWPGGALEREPLPKPTPVKAPKSLETTE